MTTNLKEKNNSGLTTRIFVTLSLLTIIRTGSFISIPYIDQDLFRSLTKENNLIVNPLSSFLTNFSGGKTPSLNLFSLGILPYINASIIIQLLTTINPQLTQLSKEEGEYGRRKIKQYTRILTFVCAIVQAIGITYNIKSFIFDWNFIIGSQISLSLISGSMIMLYFSELITKDGLKNGSSLLICFNIITNLPDQIILLSQLFHNQSILKMLLNGIILLVTYRFIILGCIFQNEGILRIPLISPKQRVRSLDQNEQNYIFEQNNLPLRVNQSGVMPVIISSGIMTILSSFLSNLNVRLASSDFIFADNIKLIFFSLPVFINKFFFWLIYGGLIFFFSKFYSKVVLNPKDLSEQLRKNSVIIKDINPGRPTQEYLTQSINYLAKVNAIILMSLIIPLEIVYKFLNISNLNGFGLTSQIILINVILETSRIIRTFNLSKKTIM